MMSRKELKSVLNNVLLALQLCLGFWQFLKLTPLGALLQSVMAWLLRPLRLSPTYTRLQCFNGRLFKTVLCRGFTEVSYMNRQPRSGIDEIRSSYLGVDFHLERRDGNMLIVNGKMAYYITEASWQELLFVGRDLTLNSNAVFVKGHKEIWEQVATGRVMTLSQILDSVILDKLYVRLLNTSNVLLLPVDLTVSEEKLLKFINLAGLFLQTKQVYWLIPTVLSTTSAVLEFSTQLRKWLYGNINMVFCCAMHMICDPLPRSARRQVYALGKWVENFKPCNDIQLKVVRGDIIAVIAGGAKAEKGGATLVPELDVGVGETRRTFRCNSTDHIDIECLYEEALNRCLIRATTFEERTQECYNRYGFKKAMTLVSCMAKNGSGSLKSYGPNNKVHVRGLIDSIADYFKNGCPPIYELKLENVIVKGGDMNY